MSFITTTDGETDRGQVGIGTLIVFIAMVLVAAIAAGVLINTAGFLQTQAEDTGTEATDQVANNLNIITEVGEVSPGERDTITEARLGAQPAAGSDDVNLERVSVQWVSDESFGNLVHIKEATVEGEGTVFNTEAVTAEDGLDNVMTDNADRYEVVVPLDQPGPFLDDVVLEGETLVIEENESTADDLGVEFANESENETIRNANFDIVVPYNESGEDDFGGTDDVANSFENVDEDDVYLVAITEEGNGSLDDVNTDDVELFVNEEDNGISAFTSEEETDDFGGDDGVIRVVAYDENVDATEIQGYEEEEELVGEEDNPDLEDEDGFEQEFHDNLNNENIEELVEGEEAELTFTTESGAQTISILQVPDSLAGEDAGDTVDL